MSFYDKDKHEEYKAPNDFTLELDFVTDGRKRPWQVTCWTHQDDHHWYVAFATEVEARAEFDRWRT